MNKYVIELRGVEFHNKGAELMLMAVLEKVRKELPGAMFVMEKNDVNAPIHKQREVGVYTKLNFKKFGVNMKHLGFLASKEMRLKHGYVLDKEINIVLDGSGFAFGDFWGAQKAGERLANHIAGWKKEGKKVILLSQAFGAFKDERLQAKMKIILDNADLIFARDKYSHEYLNEIPGKKDKIFLRPDFTNLTEGKLPAYFDKQKCEVAIIPNNKLLESNTFQDRDDYITFLKNLCKDIEKLDKKPFFLIHEGHKDLMLAEEVNKKFNLNVTILKEDDPKHVKGIIGNSFAVITSRFHGLVSSLAQAVPCLCIGWSHKYQALMEDYNYDEGLLRDNSLKGEGLREKLEMILGENTIEIREKLKSASIKQKELAQDMWSKVFEVIK
ncbi:polysaccharide pyruvyl transferase family protein [Olivibacter domesticus]|uniref:Polysaccharide pyruvyl transferase n=1 Tax=Olivibacter domesticus TaxID=407022 RepID=A0A1H7YX66_OLID1|nr:polysaccharide pyruvyl transferase family protein [Olivibacter domesticus]SEM50872.1 Polysaccharide pyruvyl transferase [Olivibacter domesticus]